MFKRSLILCGAILAVAFILSLLKSPDDWSEPCSDYELQQARAGERFNPFHVALTQEQYSRVELRRLRQTVWQDLPLCRELVEFVALSLELYNDRLFVEAAPELGDSVLDQKEYDRWYELFLRVLGEL